MVLTSPILVVLAVVVVVVVVEVVTVITISNENPIIQPV